jgi:mannosyl-oligosaccharide alpha-1,2-mannosidase
MVGGLLTVYDFTGDKLFLLKAEECAKKLMPAFNTQSGLPKASINLRSGQSSLPSWTGGAAILAEVGTMQMEFAYLSQHVNNSVYANTALKVMDVLNSIKPDNALYPMYVEVAPAKFRGGRKYRQTTLLIGSLLILSHQMCRWGLWVTVSTSTC